MGVTVAFDYPGWVEMFPEFAAPGGQIPVTSTLAQVFFDMAAGLHRNDGAGPVCDPVQQTQLLNFLTAHFAKLFAVPKGKQAAPDIVGRISSAAEGSVNVQSEWASQVSDSEAFYIQTKYGAAYWAMTKAYRMGRYLANPARPIQAGPFGYGPFVR